MNYQKEIDLLIKNAFIEDAPFGDVTTNAVVKKEVQATGYAFVKGDYVASGIDIVQRAYFLLDKEIVFKPLCNNKEYIYKGQKLFEIKGSAASMLRAERVVLNILGIMIGVATKTKFYCNLVKETGVTLLDTRKTIPCMRAFQRLAVVDGGAKNHRYSLSDAVLIKENHIIAAGGISNALKMVEHLKDIKIEIEVKNLTELKEVLSAKLPDVIMLDNMPIDMICEAVKINNNRVKLEASGGIDKETIRAYAETGVDYISLGTLTHSIDNPDISFLFDYI